MTSLAFPRCAGVAVAATLACLALAAAPLRAETRFGYIDSGRIFTEYSVAKEAQARFDRQVLGWRDEAAEKEKLVSQLRIEVRDLSPILSSLKRQEKEEALQKAISDYERFIQDVWGPQGRASQENDRATAEVVRRGRT
jgi:Skp family chaperone for outer membrane proteins